MATRRGVLSSVAASAALAGCNGIVRPDDGPDRQVPGDWRPDPGEWAAWGYDLANTSYNPHADPPGGAPTVDWAVDCDAPGETVVADGTVLCRDRGSIVAYDAADGHRLWDVTLALDGALSYVDGRTYDVASGRLTAVSLDGEVRWEDEAEGRVIVERDGYVYVGAPSEGLQWHHADTGELTGRLEASYRSFASDNRAIYAAGYDGVAAFTVADDGSLSREWSRDDVLRITWHPDGDGSGDQGRVPSPRVAVAAGMVYVLERPPDPTVDAARVRALDPTDGAVVGSLSLDQSVLGGPVLGQPSYIGLARSVERSADDSSPVEYEGGELLAFDVDRREWQTGSPAPALRAGAGSTLFGTRIDGDGGVVAVDATGGQERWTVQEGAVDGDAGASPPVLAPVAVVGETVYARAEASGRHRLVALRA